MILAPALVCQQTVQLIGKRLPVSVVERGGSAGLDTAAAQGIHEIAHVQALADIVFSVQFAAWVQGQATFVDGFRGQWDIRRDDQLAGSCVLHDVVVGYVKTG